MAISAHRFWIYLAKSAIALSLFVTVLTVNLYLLLSPVYIDWQYDQLKLGSGNGAALTHADAGAVVDYIKNGTENLPPLTIKERTHLADVRKLFNLAFDLFKLAFIVLVVALIVLSRFSTWRQSWRFVAWSSLGGFIFLSVFLFLSQIDFSWFFDRFHRLFFPENSWLFESNSTLIRLFPFRFWAQSAFFWSLLALSELAFLALGIGLMTRQKS